MADVQIARALPLAGMVHGGAEVTVSAAPAAYRPVSDMEKPTLISSDARAV